MSKQQIQAFFLWNKIRTCWAFFCWDLGTSSWPFWTFTHHPRWAKHWWRLPWTVKRSESASTKSMCGSPILDSSDLLWSAPDLTREEVDICIFGKSLGIFGIGIINWTIDPIERLSHKQYPHILISNQIAQTASHILQLSPNLAVSVLLSGFNSSVGPEGKI